MMHTIIDFTFSVKRDASAKEYEWRFNYVVNNDIRHTKNLIVASFLLDTYHSFSYIDLLECWDILADKTVNIV
jgi:hypothetical protein